jgi:quercetin dioxygenase-like cupin family protein
VQTQVTGVIITPGVLFTLSGGVMDQNKGIGPTMARALTDLVNYQEQAVVSREIIAKSVGTITVFAFDKGQGLSEHTAPFDAFVLIADGQAEITIAGVPHVVKEGETIILPAHEPHALKAAERFKMLLVMIRA